MSYTLSNLIPCTPTRAPRATIWRFFLALLFFFAIGSSWSAPAHAATFQLTYTDAAGTGFFDSTLGAARRNAFESSLSYWSTHIGASAVPINITASFTSAGRSAFLAQAGPLGFSSGFGSSNPRYKANTYYGSALANQLAGVDLDPSKAEINAQFNVDYDTPSQTDPRVFYYGLDGKAGQNFDFYSVALHEVGHGLNFLGLLGSDGTYSSGTIPSIYDTFLTVGNTGSRTRVTSLTQTARASATVSDNLFFDGTRAQFANGGAPAKVYAPTTYQSGSSVSHLDETTFSLPNINELMTPVSSGVIHDAGPVALGFFYDMGWGIPPNVISIARADATPTSSRTLRFSVLFSTPVTGVDAADFSTTTTGTIAGATVTGASGSGTTYIVTVTTTGGSGTLRLNLVDNDSIIDANSVPLGGVGTSSATPLNSGDGSYVLGAVYTIAPSGSLSSLIAVNGGTDSLRTNVVSIDGSSSTQTVITSSNPPLNNSLGVARASDGTLYVGNFSNNLIGKIAPDGTVSALPTPTTVLLSNPTDIVIGSDGLLYVANLNNTIVKVDPVSGTQTLVASAGSLNGPRGLAFGSDGFLYVGNYNANNILKINVSTGAQTVYATNNALLATGFTYYTSPWGIAFASDGSLYVCDNSPNYRIIKVAPGGASATNLTTVGAINGAEGMALGKDGNLYVANATSNSVVRVATSGGAITTVSSGGNLSSTSDVVLAEVPNPTVSISGTPSVTEGNSGTTNATFTLSLSGPSISAVTVTVATADGTATSASGDYVAISPTTYTFAAGTTSQTVTVLVNGDTNVEPDETFTINLSNPSGATLGTATATGTILNDDVSEPSGSARLIVTTTQDVTATDGLISLREAIAYANSNPGADTITFAIPSAQAVSGVFTIQLASALPTITGTGGGATTINGYSQTGASANTLVTGTNAVLNIQIKGTGLAGVNGLSIDTSNCVIKGLSIINSVCGISLSGSTATGNKVTGNYIGTTADGTAALANVSGIYISSAPSNIIGGTTAGERNLLSGNTRGIYILGSGATGNKMTGNYIGTTASGTAILANLYGVLIDSGPSNTIGGTTAGERNLISGNTNYGIFLSGSTATGNKVTGNYIGTNAGGTAALANGDGVYLSSAPSNIIGGTTIGECNLLSGNTTGVLLFGSGTTGNTVTGNYIGTAADGATTLANNTGVIISGASNNIIGGTAAGTGNIIAHNSTDGVYLAGTTTTGNSVRGNSIYANGTTTNDLGIDLVGTDGVNANDVGDADTGPNNLQNYPVLTSSLTSGGNTIITGSLNSAASTAFTLDFYSSPLADTSGYGEGKTYLGSATVTTDSGGNKSFTATLTGVTVINGYAISATATDPIGNTSEFSQDIANTFTISSSGVLIGEFRAHGSGGASDEYIELANTTTSPLNISGWSVKYLSGGSLVTANIPTNTTLPAMGHYLFMGSGYNTTLSGVSGSDQSLSSAMDDATGIMLLNAGSTVVDAVSFVGSSMAGEGTRLPSAPTANGEYAFERRQSSGNPAGIPLDNNTNSGDFIFVSTTGGAFASITGAGTTATLSSTLGAPSPNSTTGYVQMGSVAMSLLDTNVANTLSPNRVRLNAVDSGVVGAPDRFGTLRLRRTLTNNGSTTYTRVRFHAVTITTYSAGGGGGYSDPTQADVRLLTSPDETGIATSTGAKNVIGTSMQAPATGTMGGGLNANTVVLNQALTPGSSANYSFELGVARKGNFLVGFTIELLP